MTLKIKYNMLKRCIYILLLIASPLLAFSNDGTNALFKKGNDQYQKGKYKDAQVAYQKLVDDGNLSIALYYNLGNAYYKTGDIAPALLYYEKAHKLSPGDQDINANIRLANTKTADKIEAPQEFFITKWWHGFILALPADTWAIGGVLLILAGFGLLILYRLTNSVGIKKTAFFSAIAALIIGVCATFIAGRQAHYFDSHHDGIIFSSTVTVKSAPATTSKNVFVLHEGTKVEILDNTGTWIRIRLVNGSEGWVTVGDAKEI
jgi:tetratricopeptide (TPR) repeat protein